MQHGDAEHYRELAAHFHSLAETEPLPGLSSASRGSSPRSMTKWPRT
jgi:hypothetical protein